MGFESQGGRWAFFGAATLLLTRCFFGIDFTDEAYYIGLAYRFAIGDRPFIDEFAIHQTAAFFTAPFIKVWISTLSTNDGLVFFTRFLYWVFQVFIALIAVSVLSKKFSSFMSCTVGALFLLFIPFGIPNLSYNTLALGMVFLSSLWMYQYWLEQHKSWLLMTSAVALSLAQVAYPTLLPMSIVFLFLVVMGSPRDRVLSASLIFIGLQVLCALPFAVWLLQIGSEPLKWVVSVASQASEKGGGLSKFMAILKHIGEAVVFSGSAYGIWRAMILFYGKKPSEKILTPLLLVYVAALGMALTVFDPGMWVTSLAILFFLLGLEIISEKRDVFIPVLLCIGLPSGVMALLFSWTSSDSHSMFPIGLYPFFCVSPLLVPPLSPLKWLRSLPGHVALIVLLVGPLLFSQWVRIYRDFPVWKLTQVISSGPYAMQLTSAKKANFIGELNELITATEAQVSGRTFFNNFPAGYLFSRKPIEGCTIWTYTPFQAKEVNIMQKEMSRCLRKSNKPGVMGHHLMIDVRDRELGEIPTDLSKDPVLDYFKDCRTVSYPEVEGMMSYIKDGGC